MQNKIEIVPMNTLVKFPLNPRSIDADRKVNLMLKVKKWGQLGALLIDGRDRKTILGGNHVYDAMLENGIQEAKVEYVTPKDDAEALELVVLHNERFAHWVEDDLAALLKKYENNIDLASYTIDLSASTALTKVLARYGETEEDDFDSTPPITPESQEGKVYKLGRHRLMCGDSTKADDMNELMGGKLADAIVTDPPYGISYEGNPNGEEWEQIKNDDLRGVELISFIAVVFQNANQVSIPSCPAYVFYASRNHSEFQVALENADFHIYQQIIWAKNMVIGNSHYHWAHEPILYCHKGKERSPFYGDRTHKTVIETTPWKELAKLSKDELLKLVMTIKEQSTLLHAKQDSFRGIKYDHPTQKPVSIVTPLVKNSTASQGIVLDPFAGSGTTLIAAHQLDRVAYCMELDAKFCDVIRKRYAKFVGEESNWQKVTPEA